MGQQQQEEEEEGQPPGSACLWVVAVVLLLCILSGGGCLALYLSLPPADAPHWLPAAGLALVGFPWAFWIATCVYRCVGGAVVPAVEQRPSRVATVAPSPSSKSVGAGADNASGEHEQASPGGSSGGARRVHIGDATVLGSEGSCDDSGEGDKDSQHSGDGGGGRTAARDDSSSESEVPLAYTMSS